MEKIHCNIIRSNRKTLSLEITPQGKVLVRAPKRMSQEQISAFVNSKKGWLKKHLAKVKQRQQELLSVDKLTKEELTALLEKAAEVIPARVRYYAPLVGVDYGRITIRNQRTRWGSCSSKGNLNFNCLLMLTPIEVIDSIVVHELCHRLEMNHSAAFYRHVYRVYPDYDKWNKWLKINGGMILKRM